jgi:hypothetical protein
MVKAGAGISTGITVSFELKGTSDNGIKVEENYTVNPNEECSIVSLDPGVYTLVASTSEGYTVSPQGLTIVIGTSHGGIWTHDFRLAPADAEGQDEQVVEPEEEQIPDTSGGDNTGSGGNSGGETTTSQPTGNGGGSGTGTGGTGGGAKPTDPHAGKTWHAPWEEQVLVTAAWDEIIYHEAEGYYGAVAYDGTPIPETLAGNGDALADWLDLHGGGYWTGKWIQTKPAWNETIHHPAVYKTVHHEGYWG